jgi:hypothetical protein
MRAMVLLFVAGLMAPAIQPVLAGDHEGHGKHRKDRDDQGEDEDEGHYRRHGYHGQCFRAEDVRIIHDYYCPRGLPPGLQKEILSYRATTTGLAKEDAAISIRDRATVAPAS